MCLCSCVRKVWRFEKEASERSGIIVAIRVVNIRVNSAIIRMM